jgi:hypothetical protein
MTVFLLINGSLTTGSQFGYDNLYLFVDGMDQKLPSLSKKINCFQVPHIEYKRAKGDRKRAQHISKFAQELFQNYQLVLAMDIDEFLVLDPNQKCSLKAYLSQEFNSSSLSALGLDVGQHPSLEQPIDLKKALSFTTSICSSFRSLYQAYSGFKTAKLGLWFSPSKRKKLHCRF